MEIAHTDQVRSPEGDPTREGRFADDLLGTDREEEGDTPQGADERESGKSGSDRDGCTGTGRIQGSCENYERDVDTSDYDASRCS